MSDRVTAFLVTMDQDISDDEAHRVRLSMELLRGVQTVRPVTAEPMQQRAERERRDRAWERALLELVRSGPSTE